jgi:hypothetical protein
VIAYRVAPMSDSRRNLKHNHCGLGFPPTERIDGGRA